MTPVIKLIRPHHWIKNVLIFAPLILSFGFYDIQKVLLCVLAFAAWSMFASAGYVYNDLMDIESDREHPQKRFRPLASGAVSKQTALLIIGVLVATGTAVTLFLGTPAAIVIGIYIVLNWAYSTWLKRVRWLDIIILSSFYLLRIFLGGVVIDALLTNWFIVTCSFAFLAISTNKRMLTAALTTEGKLHGRGYTTEDRQQLFIYSLLFAVITVVFLNLHTIQLIGASDRPFELVVVNLLSISLLFNFFDDKHVKHDDPVKKLLGNIAVITPLILLVLFYLYLLQQAS